MCNFPKNKHVLVSFKLARKANPANNFTRCENVVYAKKVQLWFRLRWGSSWGYGWLGKLHPEVQSLDSRGIRKWCQMTRIIQERQFTKSIYHVNLPYIVFYSLLRIPMDWGWLGWSLIAESFLREYVVYCAVKNNSGKLTSLTPPLHLKRLAGLPGSLATVGHCH